MKIGNPADKPPPTAPVAPTAPVSARHGTAEAAVSRAAPPRPADAAGHASATVDLSATASTLMAGGAGADFDAEKVARIQQAIADGSFRIDAGAIADKLIANAQEVLNKISN